MKIQAIRVRDVGHFSAATALEGLSGGLDVLAAGNEAGKSTLFRALEAAFFEKHSSEGGRVKSIRPRSGESPLVEADFVTEGVAWRITKQFGRGKRALLQELGGKGRELRGIDADDMLGRLVGLHDGLPGRLGFVWVGQGNALQPLAPIAGAKRGEAEALKLIVEREVSAMTGGSLLRRLRALAIEDLGVLKTPARAGPKLRGPWDIAIKRRDQIKGQLEAAVSARSEARQRREALAANKKRRAELLAPDAVATRTELLAEAIVARDRAVASRRVLREAMARSAALDAALAETERHASALQSKIADRRALSLAIAEGAVRLAGFEREDARLRAEIAEIEARGDALRGEELRARDQLRAADQAAALAEAKIRLQGLSATLGVARALDSEIVEEARALETILVDEVLLARLIAAEAAIKRADDALAAAAPQVSIAYEAGVKPSILMDGRALPDGIVAGGSGPVRLEIPGVGVISIVAAATADRVKVCQQRDRAQAELEQGLLQFGAVDVEQFAIRHRDWALRRGALEAKRARLSGLVPAGVEALAKEIALEEARIAPIGGAEGALERGAAVARLDDIQAQLEGLRTLYSRKRAELEPVAAGVAREKGLLEGSRARLDALSLSMPPDDACEAQQSYLSEQVELARAAANEGVRERLAVQETVADEAAVAALERRVSVLQAEQANVARELRELDVAEARLEGQELEADAQGTGANVAMLEGELERATAEIGRHQADVDALGLLAQTIDAVEAENRDRYLAPVIENLDRYLGIVFPGASVKLGGDFSVDGFQRGGLVDEVDWLSGGTQEQLAVLVRLAFAGLIAQAGQPAPLILDDALVYTDDERLRRVFEALELGAQSHQVLVLTCHRNAFDALGGQRVELVPWRNAP